MKKMMLFVGTIAFLSGMGMNLQYALDDYQLRDNLVLVIQAQQTGDFSDTGTTTYQIAEATKTVAEGGWTFDVGLNIWFLNGKAQKHTMIFEGDACISITCGKVKYKKIYNTHIFI